MFSWWFLLLYKTENSQPPRAAFHHEGLKVITKGSGDGGEGRKQTLLRVEFWEKPSSSLSTPAWGMGRSRRKLTALLL